ncbi:MAG: S26 family signal peptidase [Clostridiales bacterium]|nr:S26 family signal peptidase [Clostridiales bacterium]
MKFYRLEKTNYVSVWAYALFKAVALGLLLTIGLLILFGYKFMIVSSGSMEPTLPVGSLVIVTPCEYEDLVLNDIVTMDAGGVNLTHRIVGKYNPKYDEQAKSGIESLRYLSPELIEELISAKYDGDLEATHKDADYIEYMKQYENQVWWVTKGDNSNTVDGRLTDEIVGKVSESHAFTWIGTVVRYVRGNYITLIVMLVLLMIIVGFVEWMKNMLDPDDIEVYESDED